TDRPHRATLKSTAKKCGDKPSLISTFGLRANFDLRLALQPSIDVLAHHIFGETVALLDQTFKLFALTVDLSQIVVSELAPLLFDLTLSLLPISFDDVPVHFTPPIKRMCCNRGATQRITGTTGSLSASLIEVKRAL